jgi:uncharacterized membrane protein
MKPSEEIEVLELKIARFLRWGVVLSGLLIFSGWLWELKWSADPFYSFRHYYVFPLQNILKIYYKNERWGTLISYFGLVTLICLPIIRVFLTAFLFFRQKEFKLGVIALFVLLSLGISFLLGVEH